jgi:hypothetical protein
MADREIRYLFRSKFTSGSTLLPSDGVISEPFVNVFEGRMFFYGVPGGTYTLGTGQENVFEVGGNVGFANIFSGININNKFIVTGTTGQITNYQGITNLSGYFLSGTSYGFVLAPISNIQSSAVSIYVQPGLNTYTAGTSTNPSINISAATLNSLNVSGTSLFNIISASTISANTIFVHSMSGLSPIAINGITIENKSVTASTIKADVIISGNTNLWDMFTGITYPYLVWNL